MKKALIISIALNAVIILFFAGKRWYFSYGAGTGHKSEIPFYDQWNDMRSSVYSSMKIDSGDIIFVGNSLTEGFPVTEIWGRRVKNRGVGGNTTAHLLKRIGNIAKGQPRKLFIEIGVNDLNTGYSADSAFSNYKTIIETIQYLSPGTEIFIQSLMPTCMEYTYTLNGIKSLNELLKGHCIEQGLTFIDLYTPMLKGSALDTSYTGDGIHLNNKGYAVWRNQIEKYIN